MLLSQNIQNVIFVIRIENEVVVAVIVW